MADETPVNETVVGGKYILGDNYVNAEGEVIGKVKETKADTKADSTKDDKAK